VIFYKVNAFFILLASFLAAGQLTAQSVEEREVGKLVSVEDNAPVPYVHVYNSRTGDGTASNEDGSYSLHMQVGDTLVFSAIGFEPYAFMLGKEPTERVVVANISLSTATMALEAIEGVGYKDERALKRAILDLDVPLGSGEGMPLGNLGAASTKKRNPNGLSPTGSGVAIGGPVTALYNAFSKRAKQEKKYAQYQQAYKKNKLVEAKYNAGFVGEVTGLQAQDLEQFMIFCQLSDEFILDASTYQLVVAIHQCYRDFEMQQDQDTTKD